MARPRRRISRLQGEGPETVWHRWPVAPAGHDWDCVLPAWSHTHPDRKLYVHHSTHADSDANPGAHSHTTPYACPGAIGCAHFHTYSISYTYIDVYHRSHAYNRTVAPVDPSPLHRVSHSQS